MKNLLLASAVVASAALAMPSVADAKVKIGIFFGTPHYDYRVGPDYRYRQGYGWYRPSHYGHRDRLSCGEAKRIVRRSGYDDVSTIECNGRTYTFEGENRRGREVTIYVNSRTGQLWRG